MLSKANFFLLFLTFLLLEPLTGKASPLWVEKVMAWTINGQFEKAENFLHQKIVQSDSALVPCFYLASVLNSKMNYYENESQANEFTDLLHYVIERTNRYLENSTEYDSLLGRWYFYRGSAYGYLAYFQGQNGQWFAALKNGLRAVHDLRTAIQHDSTLYEAYLGLGTYKYWRSTKLKLALWLPFVPDQREEGIRDIKRAMQTTSNSRYMALHQLVYILTDYGKYDEALRYAREGVAAFPQSAFMWWAYAHTYFKAHDYPKALHAYSHLLQIIENDYQKNRSQWLACQLRLAEIHLRLGQVRQAHALAAEILAKEKQFPATDLNKKRLKKAQIILKKTQ